MLTARSPLGHTSGMSTRWDRLVTAWLAERNSERTRGAYRADLEAYADWCRRGGVSPLKSSRDDLDAYRDASLAGGASPATVARRLSALASFFRHAEQVGEVNENPMADVDRPSSERGERSPVLEADELASLVRAAQHLGPKTAALVALLALDGIKLNEALAADIPSVHLARGAARATTGSWLGVDRRGKQARVAITGHSAQLLGQYIAARRQGPLFLGDSATGDHSSRLTRFGADYLIKRAGVAAELPRSVSANVLRRSYVDAALRAGTALGDVTQHLGHRETRQTTRLIDGPVPGA
jgi:integrase/recombinase XerD